MESGCALDAAMFCSAAHADNIDTNNIE